MPPCNIAVVCCCRLEAQVGVSNEAIFVLHNTGVVRNLYFDLIGFIVRMHRLEARIRRLRIRLLWIGLLLRGGRLHPCFYRFARFVPRPPAATMQGSPWGGSKPNSREQTPERGGHSTEPVAYTVVAYQDESIKVTDVQLFSRKYVAWSTPEGDRMRCSATGPVLKTARGMPG